MQQDVRNNPSIYQVFCMMIIDLNQCLQKSKTTSCAVTFASSQYSRLSRISLYTRNKYMLKLRTQVSKYLTSILYKYLVCATLSAKYCMGTHYYIHKINGLWITISIISGCLPVSPFRLRSKGMSCKTIIY